MYSNSCGVANGFLVMLTLLIVLVYSVILLMLILMHKGQNRIDFLIFFALILLPLVYIIFLI